MSLHSNEHIAAAATDARSASPLPPTHSLRILIVDDNHINLSVLSTLLKRRFGHALARPPVSLDSGLKALQLLRTEIFDLIFMDIEMPYLNGVECTRRIRAGEDGILSANRNAHIVAVTTNVGPEPASLYRHVSMDGMISKPVRFQDFQQYLCPLSVEALEAKGSVTPILVGSERVMPPLPPIELEQRLFFVPTANGGMVTMSKSNSDAGSPTSEYSNANQFAAMLKAQTSKSLRERRALSVARSATMSEPRRSSFNSPRSEHLPSMIRSSQQSTSADTTAVTVDDIVDGAAPGQDQSGKRLSSVPTLSFQSLIERETREREQDGIIERQVPVPVRPVPIHRISSPAYMLDASPINRLRDEPAMRSNPDLVPRAVRPGIRPVAQPLRRTDSAGSADSVSDASGGYLGTESSSAWSSIPSSEYASTTQRSASLDMLSSFSNHRATSPSSSVTTPSSTPADKGALEAGFDEEDELRTAVFSPCDDDMLRPRATPSLGYLNARILPAVSSLSKQAMSPQNSPRVVVYNADDNHKYHGCGNLCSRMDQMQLEQDHALS